MRLPHQRRLVPAAACGLLLLSLIAITASANAAADDVVASYDFESGTTQGWFARGASAVAATPEAARSGGFGLRTTGRTASWNGPSVELAGVLQTGATYAVSAYARLVAGQPAATLQLTMQRTPVGGSTAFDFITNGSVTDATWVRLLGSYTVPSDSSQLQVYVESSDATLSFDLDDITVTMTSPPPNGPPDEAGVTANFEDGTSQGWAPRINSEVLAATTADAHSGQFSLLNTGRTQVYAGPARNMLGKISKGKKYTFDAWVKLAPGEAPADIRFSIERRLAGTPTYATIASAPGVTADAWTHVTGSYTLGADVDFLSVYFETANGLASFYLDDFAMAFVRPLPIQTDIPSLKDVLANDFEIGAASSPADTLGVSAELMAKHFNSTTPGNAMKWDATEPTEGQFRFADADAVANFARDHSIALRGHTLVWHSQTPAWVFQHTDGTPLTNSEADKALLLQRIETHIRAVAGRYAGQITAWDVANEVIDEGQADGLRRSPWFQIAGLDYLRTAFRVAREVAPNAKLYINDYNTEYPRKRKALFDVVRKLRAEGVAIDGVGHQLHMNIERQRLVEIERTFDLFATLGVLQQVTELDISTYTNFVESMPSIPPDTIALQGYRYRDLFDLFRRHRSQLNSITVWGASDERTWLKSFPFPRLDLPLLFDEQLQAKPAYWGIVDPTKLPEVNRLLSVSSGSPMVDGARELEWDQLQGLAVDVSSRTGLAVNFQVRWDAGRLYLLADVTDPTCDLADSLTFYVDRDNGKTATYEADDSSYVVRRDGRHARGFAAKTTEIRGGYRVEASVPLTGAAGAKVGFDLRAADAALSAVASWNDNAGGQDADTSRWGTLTLIPAVARVETRKGTPVIDGVAESVWKGTPITTAVPVSGSGGASATAKLLWDAHHIYVFATVADPVLDETSANAYEQDSVEIFVDPDNSKSLGYNDDDGLYRISFSNKQTISGNFGAYLISGNLTSATRVVPGGYVVEASIELDTVTLAKNGLVGFELQVNDASNGARTSVRTWQDPTGLSYLNTSRWGVLRLAG